MPKVTAHDGTVLAESDKTIVVEGNHYFPPDSLVDKESVFLHSDTITTCPWKGKASYYNIKLPDGTVITDGAWYYREPKDESVKRIAYYAAFYKNKVKVEA